MLNFLSYQGPAGPVEDADVFAALRLMGLGMLGILVVMLLVYAVVVILNHFGKKKKDKTKNDG